MQDWKMQHQSAGLEIAGLDDAAPESRGGKWGTKPVWKAKRRIV